MKKRILSLLLCLVLCLTLLPPAALAATLPNMNVTLTGDTLFWEAVTGAVKYKFTVANGGGFTEATSLDLKTRCNSYQTSAGEKNCSVYAIDENDRRITEIWTGTYTYTPIGTLSAPANVTWQSSGFKADWTAVEHAEAYNVELYRMDTMPGTPEKVATYLGVTANSIDFTKAKRTISGETIAPLDDPVPGAYYMVSVKAVSSSGYAPSEETDSSYEQLVSGTVGNIENITLSGSTLSWSAYSGATVYEVYFRNYGCTVSDTSIDLENEMDFMGLANGDYPIRITAYSKSSYNGGQKLSLTTEGPTYTYTGNGPLSAPTGLYWDGFTARWDAVVHADSYQVTVTRQSDGEVFKNVTVLASSLASSNFLDMGTPIPGESYLFTVEAVSSHGYSSSPVASSPWAFFPMTYSVICAAAANGSVSTDVKKAEEGQLVTVTASPSKGCYCTGITVDGAPLSGNTFFMPDHAVTVEAAFAPYEVINAVECEIVMPQAGNLPGKAVTVPSGANYTAVISSIKKQYTDTEHTDPLVGGDVYSYELVFTANTGYGFADNLDVTVNGASRGLISGPVSARTFPLLLKAENAPLSGTINVTGELKYQETLTASWSGSGSAAFHWYLNDELAASNTNTFAISYSDHIGKALTVKATALGYSGEVSKSLGVIGKADAPAAPTLTYTKPTETGAYNGTISTTDQMEWTTNPSGDWTACTGGLENLTAGTYYVRYAETSTREASGYTIVSIPDGNGTILAAQAYVAQPIVGETTSNTLTAGDTTFTVSCSPYDYGDYISYDQLTFTAAEGYQFNGSTVFTLNGTIITIQNKLSNETGGYNKVSGFVRINKIKLPLTGTLTVTGTGEYDTNLTASFTDGNEISPKYQWYVNGEATGYTTTSFTVYGNHIGKQITVRVTDKSREGYIESVPILGIRRTGYYSAPVVNVYSKPSVPGAADGQFSCHDFWYGRREYSVDGVTWTEIPENTTYLNAAAGTYYFRVMGDHENEPGYITTITMPEADTLIPFAACTIATPVDGAAPAAAVMVPAGANYTVTAENCQKTSDYTLVTGTFEAPNHYRYNLKFTANPGYKFQYVGKGGVAATTFKINGVTAFKSGGENLSGACAYIYAYADYQCAYAPLAGTLEIAGDPLCGNTVTASLTGGNASGTLTYTWYLDGVQQSVGNSFNINYEGWIGKELTVELTDSKHPGSKLISPGVTVYEVGKIKLPKPAVSFAATGPDSGTLYGFTIGSHAYKIDSGEWTNVATGLSSVDLTELSACTISVKCVGNGTTTVDSDSQTISVGKAATPTLTATQPTSVGGRGSIPGVTAAMEYKKGESGGWTDCPDGALADLAPDTYFVRIKASGATLASEAQTIIIEEFSIPFSAVRSGKTVTVSVDDLPETGLLIVAEYSGGQMIGVWTADCAANTALHPAFTVSSSTTDVKCFLVSAASYAPLAGAISPTPAA